MVENYVCALLLLVGLNSGASILRSEQKDLPAPLLEDFSDFRMESERLLVDLGTCMKSHGLYYTHERLSFSSMLKLSSWLSTAFVKNTGGGDSCYLSFRKVTVVGISIPVSMTLKSKSLSVLYL